MLCGTGRAKRWVGVAVLAGSVLLLSWLTYRDMLGYWFTATDTLTLIDTSRVHSLGDLVRILTKPMGYPSRLTARFQYFRPVASLSYSLDYRLWGLNPFGYHLTDLVLQSAVSLCVFWFVWWVTGGKPLVAWLTAVLFTLHPVLAEAVPAPARRHDLMAALFMLGCLLCFARLCAGRHNKGLLVFSLLLCALALGSKEIAIILPVLLLTYAVVFSEQASVRSRVARALRLNLPYLGLTAAFLAWRIVVLKGVGGLLDPTLAVLSRPQIVAKYCLDLVYVTPSLGAAIFLVLLVLAWPAERGNQRLLGFALLWLSLPLLVYVVTRAFSHRTMYAAAIPWAICLSALLAGGAEPFVAAWASAKSRWLLLLRRGGGLGAAAVLVVPVLVCSPLVREYEEWPESGRISSMFLRQLSARVAELPNDCVIHIYDLPAGITSHHAKVPHVKDVAYLADYSIKSWLDLTHPGNRMEVVVRSRSAPAVCPAMVRLDTAIRDGAVTVRVVCQAQRTEGARW